MKHTTKRKTNPPRIKLNISYLKIGPSWSHSAFPKNLSLFSPVSPQSVSVTFPSLSTVSQRYFPQFLHSMSALLSPVPPQYISVTFSSPSTIYQRYFLQSLHNKLVVYHQHWELDAALRITFKVLCWGPKATGMKPVSLPQLQLDAAW
jgi:hypothetical protein